MLLLRKLWNKILKPALINHNDFKIRLLQTKVVAFLKSVGELQRIVHKHSRKNKFGSGCALQFTFCL